MRHHDFRRDGSKTIDEDGLVGIAGDDVEAKVAHIAGGVGMFAVARLEMAIAEIDARVTGSSAGLMAVGTIVIKIGQRSFVERTGFRFVPDGDFGKVVWSAF